MFSLKQQAYLIALIYNVKYVQFAITAIQINQYVK